MGKQIFNFSKQMLEKATQESCPRCLGFGGQSKDDEKCYLCNGVGYLWLTATGWTLKFYGRKNKDEILY